MRYSTSALCAVLLLGLPGAAWADEPVTAARATDLERQIRDTIVDYLGDSESVPARPVRLTADDGDAYQAEIVLEGSYLGDLLSIVSDPVTLRVSRRADGRWALSDIVLPSRISVGAGSALPPPLNDNMPLVAFKMADQASSGVWDPEIGLIALDGRYDRLVVASPMEGSIQSYGSLDGRHSILPRADGLVDVRNESEATDYRDEQPMLPDRILLSARRYDTTSEVLGLDLGKADAFARAAARFTGLLLRWARETADFEADPFAPGGPFEEPARTMAAEGLAAIRGAVQQIGYSFTLEDFAVEAFGFNASAARIFSTFELDAALPTVVARTEFVLEDVAEPALAGMSYELLLPRRLSAVVTVSAPGASGYLDLAARGLDPAADLDLVAEDAFGQLVANGLTIDIEALDYATDDLAFHASGSLKLVRGEDVVGRVRVEAAGLERFDERLIGTPEAVELMMALTTARVLARQEGGRLVWDFEIDGDRALVNGQDLDSIAP